MFREKFSKRLRELRLSRGLSQEQLANRVDASTNAIGMYETGKRMPREEILEKLHEYFGVSLDYLFGFSDDPNPYQEKEIDVFKIQRMEERVLLMETEEKVLFRNGDFAVKVTEEIAESLSPFYFINDILVFEGNGYIKNKLSLFICEERYNIAKLIKKGDCYSAEFLNPVFDERNFKVEKCELIGTVSGMIRVIKK